MSDLIWKKTATKPENPRKTYSSFLFLSCALCWSPLTNICWPHFELQDMRSRLYTQFLSRNPMVMSKNQNPAARRQKSKNYLRKNDSNNPFARLKTSMLVYVCIYLYIYIYVCVYIRMHYTMIYDIWYIYIYTYYSIYYIT